MAGLRRDATEIIAVRDCKTHSPELKTIETTGGRFSPRGKVEELLKRLSSEGERQYLFELADLLRSKVRCVAL